MNNIQQVNYKQFQVVIQTLGVVFDYMEHALLLNRRTAIQLYSLVLSKACTSI